MREYTLRNDGLCNTITTVTKDNYIAVGAAMRGRYNSDGKTEQKIEVRDDELSNALTTVSNCGTTFAGTTLIIEVDKENKD